MNHSSPNPRIQRLTPLDDALARLAAETPLAPPLTRAVADATGAVLASDIRAPADLPASPVAYSDGWAVNAEDLVGASAYSAAVIAPPPTWVDADDPMPSGVDSVVPPDAVTIPAPGMAEASASVAPGHGVRNTGQDVKSGALLIPAGTRLAPRHIGILTLSGFGTIDVRMPRIRIVLASAAAARHADMVRMWLQLAGTEIAETISVPGARNDLAAAYRKPGADFILSLGGTGQGRSDCAVAALKDAGTVELQGVALRPGETSSFGRVGTVPVLLLPGRADGVIAGVLALAKPIVTGLSGLTQPDWLAPVRLASKASSTIGLTEFFLGLPEKEAIRPLPLDEAGFEALGRAVGWFTVPPGSEGFAAGDVVHLRPFQPR
ncbi:molybdopterin-binding protein [Terrihabitans soli]|uniref:Molybdopterin molybdenumtransferase n=1 Tax=Terrihabitans soli TaxID=708113 RepID=A0A6S6QS26_9HYPH|nr:molybdopterin-binding protein [Terrihabitans soli]BCJ91869.1 molybdopterin-binding protein [Terrihabitans soli]